VLVIPKEEYKDIFELPPELMSEVSIVTQKVSKAVKAITGCDGINLLQNNGKGLFVKETLRVFQDFDNLTLL